MPSSLPTLYVRWHRGHAAVRRGRDPGTGEVNRVHAEQPSNGEGGARAEGYLGSCAKHWSERAIDRCEDCGELWCADCLVPTTGRRQRTRCIDCALIAAGVRAPGSRRSHVTSMGRSQRRPTNLF